jgi:hypothetical protein
MARVPTKEEVEALTAASESEESLKRLDQQSVGKDFVNNGQGVMSEEVWKNLPGRSIKDPEATE